MDYEIQNLEPHEVPFVYSAYQRPEWDTSTGCIVHMRGDYGENGGGYNGKAGSMYRTYWDHCRELSSKEFAAEFDQLVEKLLCGCLSNRSSLLQFCQSRKFLELPDSEGTRILYGFKVVTDRYVYCFRATPYRGEYDLYVYAYVKELYDAASRAIQEGD